MARREVSSDTTTPSRRRPASKCANPRNRFFVDIWPDDRQDDGTLDYSTSRLSRADGSHAFRPERSRLTEPPWFDIPAPPTDGSTGCLPFTPPSNFRSVSARKTCPVVGLVGGVGSGKSTLARRLAERYGVAVIDADAAGHRALTDPAVKTRIRRRFGDDVFASGEVNRSRLAKLVFGPSPEHAAAKADLEAITHPVIRRALERQIAECQASGAPAILLDAAVLLETDWHETCHAVVFVETPEPLRKARVAARGWTEAEWARREASQLPLSEKRRRADAVIDNSGPLDAAADGLAAAIERLCHIRLPGSAALATASA